MKLLEIENLGKRYGDWWALRDVSLSLEAGEIVGVIGRNGAGKSTLLKLLAGISEPSAGRATLWRRPASLLELGTGFHPDLSGRENVFLNAALFGMSRAEVRRKFDSIVAFAEVGAFIDTPVKHYSSGMAVRLAFSVAAHLERQLLLLDEALAVGDFAFQQKSVARIEAACAQGAGCLLVSHNLGLIERLCRRTLVLHQGRPAFLGPSGEALRTYLRIDGERPREWRRDAAPEQPLQVRRVAVTGPEGDARSEVGYDEPFRIVVDYDINIPTPGTNVGVALSAAGGALAFATAEFDMRPDLRQPRAAGSYRAEVAVPAKWLNTGRFTVLLLWTIGPTPADYRAEEALVFDIVETGTPAARHGQTRYGVFQPELPWSVAPVC